MFGAEVPKIADAGDASAVELGMRFSPTVLGLSGQFCSSAVDHGRLRRPSCRCLQHSARQFPDRQLSGEQLLRRYRVHHG
jgi:hypothetical protein